MLQQQQPQKQHKTTRAFEGQNPLKLVINDVLGPEAKCYLLKEFGYLEKTDIKTNGFYLNARTKHPHPYSAFTRRHFNTMLVEGILKDRDTLDIGASVGRNYANRWNRVFGMTPQLDARDIMRKTQLLHRHADVTEAVLYANHCEHRASGQYVPSAQSGICVHARSGCAVCDRDYTNVIAIDSIYYDGVHQEILTRIKRTGSVAYFTMFDFDKQRRAGKLGCVGFDRELSTRIDGDYAYTAVHGNPSEYKSRIVNSYGGAWQYWYSEVYFLFEKLEVLAHGELEYCLVRVTPIGSEKMEGVPIVPSFFYKSPDVSINIGPGYRAYGYQEQEFKDMLASTFGDSLENAVIVGDDVTLTIRKEKKLPYFLKRLPILELVYWNRTLNTYKAKTSVVMEMLPQFLGRYTGADVVRNVRKHVGDELKKGGTWTTSRISQLRANATVAMHMSAVLAGNIAEYCNESKVVSSYKSVFSGAKLPKIRFDWAYFWKLIQVISIFLGLMLLSNYVGVRAEPQTEVPYVVGGELTVWTVVALCIAFAASIKRDNHLEPRREIKGSCVFDLSRMTPVKGRFDPKWKIRDPEWNFNDAECDAKDKIFGHQIAPLFKYPGYTEPTVKHPCKRVAIAAAIRATSNLVHYDPTVLKDWQLWFRQTILPLFSRALDKEDLIIDIHTWLKKYPEAYRARMLSDLKKPEFDTASHWKYQSFPKVELQFTEVDSQDKETDLNTVKERQISGPDNWKKLIANPVINALEGVAHRHIKTYCGMKDWPGICKTIELQTENLWDPIYGAADGSGFDMTQFPEMHKMVDELIQMCMNHSNVVLKEPLDKDRVMEVLRDSHILDVDVGRGAINYRAEGRASGDGWTTFGNTVLMMSYWMYTFQKAKIGKYCLLVKGDDVLFALEKKEIQLLEQSVELLFLRKQELRAHGLGQICKFIKYGDIEDMDFLSNYFFLGNNGKLRMSRIPARVIQTISWSTKVPENSDLVKARQELCFSKGHSLLAWSRGLPIFEPLARKMIGLGKAGKLTDFNEHVDVSRTWEDVDDRESYISFLNYRFGLTEEAVKEIERKIASIKSLDQVLDVPEVSLLFGNC